MTASTIINNGDKLEKSPNKVNSTNSTTTSPAAESLPSRVQVPVDIKGVVQGEAKKTPPVANAKNEADGKQTSLKERFLLGNFRAKRTLPDSITSRSDSPFSSFSGTNAIGTVIGGPNPFGQVKKLENNRSPTVNNQYHQHRKTHSAGTAATFNQHSSLDGPIIESLAFENSRKGRKSLFASFFSSSSGESDKKERKRSLFIEKSASSGLRELTETEDLDRSTSLDGSVSSSDHLKQRKRNRGLSVTRGTFREKRMDQEERGKLQGGGKKESDFFNLVLLCILYLIQGIPLGLALGSIPYILKGMTEAKLTYSDIAIFSVASYPYSLKILWSPIVDSFYSSSIGRRKSWIIPIQTLMGISFLLIAHYCDILFDPKAIDIKHLTVIFTGVVMLAATQDIAVDGWSLTILSRKNIEQGSVCQTIGLNSGFFLSFTVFLAFSSPEFCNKYLRSVPNPEPVVSLQSYLTFWGVVCLLVTLFLIFFKREKTAEEVHREFMEERRSHGDYEDEALVEPTVFETYKIMWETLKIECVQKLILILLVCRIGTIATEAISNFKLLELGFKKEDLAFITLFEFPCQLFFGSLVNALLTRQEPLKPWVNGYVLRLIMAVVTTFIISIFPKGSTFIPTWYYLLILVTSIMVNGAGTMMFVTQGSFFSLISDPKVGGTYLTLLNTVSNFGSNFPKFFVLEGVDYLTDSFCSIKTPNSSNSTLEASVLNCLSESAKEECKALGGTCIVNRDGFFVLSYLSIAFGIIIYIVYMRSALRKIQSYPKAAWLIQKPSTTKSSSPRTGERELKGQKIH